MRKRCVTNRQREPDKRTDKKNPTKMTRTPRTNRSDGDQTSRQILHAAGPLFAAVGFAEATGKAIAERAGVDVASINYHFGGRAGLYEAALVEAHRQLISLAELEAIGASGHAAADKLGMLIDVLLGVALSHDGWPAHLLAREVLAPSSHFKVVLDSEIAPKVLAVQGILSEATGIPVGDPALLRSMVSIMAPCLMLAVAGSGGGVPGPAQALRQMPKEALSVHLRTFAMGGLAAVVQQRQMPAAPAAKRTAAKKKAVAPAK